VHLGPGVIKATVAYHESKKAAVDKKKEKKENRLDAVWLVAY
jgi:hypothetical protein